MQSRARNPYTLGQFAGVCGVLLTLSCGLIWLAFDRRAQILQILDHGVLTQATTGSQYHGKTSGTWYRFRVNGVGYSGHTGNLYPSDESIQVQYVPDDPGQNAEKGTLSRTGADKLAWGSIAIGPAYCAIAGIIFLFKRRQLS